MYYKCEYCDSEYAVTNCPNCGAPRTTPTNSVSNNNVSFKAFNTKKTKNKYNITEQASFVVLMIILFFPVGFYFMWKNKVFKTSTRLVITAFLTFCLLFIILTNESDDTVNTAAPNNDKAAEVAATSTSVPTTLSPTPTKKTTVPRRTLLNVSAVISLWFAYLVFFIHKIDNDLHGFTFLIFFHWT
jgi:hypothetical protein